jgi:hypothetical protein
MYWGDLSEADFTNPKKLKVMWDIVSKTINRQKREFRTCKQNDAEFRK